MPKLYFVPGILGSELHLAATPIDVIWANPGALIFGMGGLALAPDGVSPRNPDGVECEAGPPLGWATVAPFTARPIYGPFLRKLDTMPQLSDFEVVPFGYDWRLLIETTGLELANKIDREVSGSDTPCTIVAHSQGGLLARVAWSVLKARGKESNVRRIITIATPHRGSYSPVMVWSGDDEMLDQLMGLYNRINPNNVTKLELMNVSTTWPSMYELMPLLDQVYATTDPQRAALFDKSNWPEEVEVSEQWLQHALYTWQPFLRSPQAIPPYSVLTTIAGTGRSTPYLNRSGDRVGAPSNVADTGDGDTRVTVDAGILAAPASRSYVFSGSHSDLFMQTAFLDQLPDMILEERTGPPAGTVVSPLGGLPGQGGPPFFGIVSGVYDC